MVYLGTGTFWVTVGQAVSSLSALIASVAFANLLSAETYGAYKYVLSIAGMFSAFSLPGIITAVSRSTAQKKDPNLWEAARERAVWSLVGLSFALIGAAYYFIRENYTLASALAIIGMTLPFFDTFTVYNGYLTGKKNFRLQTVYHAVTQSVSVTALVSTLAVTDNIVVILLAYFVPLAAVRFIFFKTVSATLPHASSDPELLTYGRHLSVMSSFGTISSNIDKFLLWHFLGPAQVAVYTFATAIPEQMKGPLKGMGDLVLPKFAERSAREVADGMGALWRKTAIYGFVLAAGAAVYIAAAPYVYKLLFPQYLESVLYSQLFALSLPAAISVVPFAVLTAQKKTKEQYFLNVAQPVIQTLLFVIGIPLGGIMGGIAAWIVGRVLTTVLVIFVTARTFTATSSSPEHT